MRSIMGLTLALLCLFGGVVYAENPPASGDNLDVLHFATRLQRFEELVFKLVPGDNEEARLILKGLDVLSGEIADYRIRRRPSDPAIQSLSDRIIKLRQDILRIESASPEAVQTEAIRQTENLKKLSWDLGNLEDRVSRLADAADKSEEKTRLLSGRTLPAAAEDIRRHQQALAEGLVSVSEANSIMAMIQERLLANPGIYDFDPKLIDQLSANRRRLDDLQALLIQRKQAFSSVVDAIDELNQIDNEIAQYPSAYAQAVSDFRANLYLSSPEAFSIEMRQAHKKLKEAEQMIEEGRRVDATALLVEARDAYERWAPTYQKAEDLYLAVKTEHDRVDAIGARRTALYAFLFQSLAGSLRDPGALEKAESSGIKKYLRAVEPLHDDFMFLVDRYQTVAETWSYVGGAGLQKRLQALLLDIPAPATGKTKVVRNK